MSRRKPTKRMKRILEAVPPISDEAKKAEADRENQKQANARMVWRKLNRLDTCAISLRNVTNFDPPDPAGPPNKHVVLDADGADFPMIGVIRSRAIKFLEALDRFEDVARWVTDHPTEQVDELAVPQLHITLNRTPEELASYPKKSDVLTTGTDGAVADDA